MQIRDITVEVRNRELERVGTITPEFLSGKFHPVWCGVGSWEVTLPHDHPMVPHLQEKGSGVIVTGPVGTFPANAVNGLTVYGVIMSGPTTTPTAERTQKTPRGLYTFAGVTDEAILAGALAYPDPLGSADPTAQTKANDVRTGTVEDLLRQYTAFNVSFDQALPGRVRGLRQFLDIGGTSLGRGPVIVKSPRFQNLLILLQEITANYPDLGFRVVQVGDILEFQVVESRDRRGVVRFDVDNGSLTSEQVVKSPPSVTYAISAGQGEGTGRKIVVRTNAEAVAAEDDWGLVNEVFLDRRDTDDTAELEQAGDEALYDGRGGVSAKVTPSEALGMALGRDWFLGDRAVAVIDNVETTVRIAEAVIIVGENGVAVGAALGDVSGFTVQSAESKRADSLDDRVARLERQELAPRISNVGAKVTDWNAATEAGFYYSDASAANRPTITALGATGWAGQVIPTGDGALTQVAWPAGLSASWVTIRTRTVAGVWSNWTTNSIVRATNLNDALDTGTYVSFGSDFNMPPYPSAAFWWIEVTNVSQRSIQYARPWTAHKPAWRRHRNLPGDGSWTAWEAVEVGSMGRRSNETATITNAVRNLLWTEISMNSTYTAFTLNGATGVFTCQVTGYYQVSASVGMGAASAAGTSVVLVGRRNGVGFASEVAPADTTQGRTGSFSRLQFFNAGDSLDVQVNTVGGTVPQAGGPARNSIDIVHVGGGS